MMRVPPMIQTPLSYCTMCGEPADKKVKGIGRSRWLPYCGPHAVTFMKILQILNIAHLVEVLPI